MFHAVSHGYDVYGRLTVTMQSTKTDTWTYDVLGRQVTYANSLDNGAILDQKETWEYDNRGRMTKHSLHGSDGSGPATRPSESSPTQDADEPATHT